MAVDMMTKLLAIGEDVKKLPPSKAREEILQKISWLIPEIVDIAAAPKGNTGLPCPYCRQSLPRLVLTRTTDATVRTVDVHVAAPAQNRAEAKALCSLLMSMYG